MSNPFTTKDPLADVIKQVVLGEKKLTDAELKKREEIVLAIKRENPDMEKSRAYAIATAQAKKVAEEVELDEAMKPFTDADHATADKHGTKIEKNIEHIKKVPTKHLQYLYHHNMGYSGGGGHEAPHLPHIKAELKKRGAKPLSHTEGEKMFNESVDQIDELSKGTLGKYIGKAVVDVHNDARFAGESGSKDASKKAFKRLLGVKSAAARLSKQNVSGGRISNYRSKTAMFGEQLENFWEAYTTMFNEAEDQQQNILLRAMAKDPSDLMKMKRAIKMGDKALTNPALRQEILAMLDKMMNLTTGDPSLLQRTKAGFQKAKTMKMPEEVQLEEGFTHYRYSGHVNGKDYEVHIPRKHDLGDYSDHQLHKKISRENPHLHHHEVTAVVHSGGEEDSHVEVEHKGQKYKHHVYNEQEPDYVYEEVQLEAIGAKDKQDEGEYGYEGDMAMSQLRTIIRNCQEMMKVLDKETDMPEWVQSKITLATDYLQTANDYLMSELEEAANPAQQAAIAIAMKKAGKKPKNEEVEQDADEKKVGYRIAHARGSEHAISATPMYKTTRSKTAVKAAKERAEKEMADAHAEVKKTPVSKFLQTRKGDGKVRTEEVEKAPFEGGREVKSTKPAAERVKKIAKGMQKQYTKDKK